MIRNEYEIISAKMLIYQLVTNDKVQENSKAF